MITVAYYTKAYLEEACRLLRSLAVLPVSTDSRYFVKCLPDTGSWRGNAHLRPKFLQECCHAFPGQMILSLDADAVVHADPWPTLYADFGPETCDIAPGVLGSELLPGTLLLNPSGQTDKLLMAWESLNQARPQSEDRINFRAAITSLPHLRLSMLPPELCWIFDLSAKRYGARTPVIEHLQASREFRNPDKPDPRNGARQARIVQLEEEARGTTKNTKGTEGREEETTATRDTKGTEEEGICGKQSLVAGLAQLGEVFGDEVKGLP